MKTRAIVLFLALLLPVVAVAVDHTVDEGDINLGYMNVYDLSDVYLWESSWGFTDLVFYYNGDGTLTLEPNHIGDFSDYWYDQVTWDGLKKMEANGYAQVDDGYAGVHLNFSCEVLSNSLTDAHSVKMFIKDFAPDFSSFVQEVVVLDATGHYEISMDTVNEAGRHVQWGFQMYGVNVHPDRAAEFGNMVVGPDPQVVATENTTFGGVKALYR